MTLTAGTVTDPDSPDPSRPVTVTGWQWQGDSTNIDDATSATYTPAEADLDKTIQVMVTYTDGHGPGKTLTSAPTEAVIAAPASTDADLSGLTIADNNGTTVVLDPIFDAASPDTEDYTASVANGITSVTLTPTTADAAASLTVQSAAVARDATSEPINLTVGANAIAIVVTAEDGTTTKTYTVTVTRADNTAPDLSGNEASPMVAENTPITTVVTTYTATDVENNTITWALTGTDASFFTLDGTSGALTFNTSPDYETQSTYALTVTATDDGMPNETSTLEVTVTVTNEDEEGTIGAITGTAQVGQTLTAGEVTDPDNVVADSITYQWQSAASSGGDYTDITGATNAATYMPVVADIDQTIQVMVTYTDGHGPDKTLTSAATEVVTAAPVSADADLSGLTIADNNGVAVVLDPIFDAASPDIEDYTASVDNEVTSVTLTPTTADAAASVTVAGGEASNPIALTVGANAIAIIVTAEDDTTTKTYTVTVTRAGNTAPSVETGNETPMVAENTPITTEVAIYRATDVENNAITWALTGTDASFFTLDGTSGALTFNTSPDYETQSTYALTVTATDDGTPSETSTLEVTVTVTNEDEEGAIGAITGTAQVGQTLTAGEVTDPDSPSTSVTVTNYQWQSDSTNIDGATSETYTPAEADLDKTIQVMVTYTDGHGPGKTLTSAPTEAVIAAPASTDADLSALTISEGTLSPAFAAATDTYAVSVANGVTSVTLTPTTADAAASVTVAGTDTTSGDASAAIDLTAGEAKAIAIVVTAEDDTTTKTYTVTVTRAGNSAPDLSGNEASPMVAENTPITTIVATYSATDAENNTIAWTLTGTDASFFTLDGTSGALTFNTSPDYESPQDTDADNEYQVTVTATDDGTPSESRNIDVTIIVANAEETGTLGAIDGSAQVGEQLTTGAVTDPDSPDPSRPVTVTGWQWQGDSTNIDGATSATYTPAEADLDKTIQVMVTYTDGHGPGKTLTSAPTEAVIAAPASTDADLSGLTIADNNDTAVVLDPIFDAASPDTLDYTASVANGITSVTLTPTTADDAASLTVQSAAVARDATSEPINLTVGANAIAIVVTAEDGTTTKTYTVTVTRAAPPNQPPVANAGADQSVTTDATVTLSGSATDPDQASDSLTYLWTQTSGTPAVTLNAADTATAEFTAPDVATVLVFTLTVTDDAGISDTDTVTITVTAPLAFSAGPALTNNSLFASGDFAADGNTLTLTFSVNQALANPPSVVFSGHDRFTDVYTPFATVTATKDVGDNNDYTAEYTVVAAAVDPQQDQVVGYDIGAMVAADNPDNTFDPVPADVDIQIDVRAPTASFGSLPALFVDRSAAVRLTIDDEGAHQSLTTSDVTATNAKDLALARVTGTDEYAVTFTPMAAGEVVITFNSTGRVTDSAGNVIAAASAAGTAVLSADADLSSLTIADNNSMAVVLDPIFDAAAPDIVDYAASVA